jgi:hypothetical protein
VRQHGGNGNRCREAATFCDLRASPRKTEFLTRARKRLSRERVARAAVAGAKRAAQFKSLGFRQRKAKL